MSVPTRAGTRRWSPWTDPAWLLGEFLVLCVVWLFATGSWFVGGALAISGGCGLLAAREWRRGRGGRRIGREAVPMKTVEVVAITGLALALIAGVLLVFLSALTTIWMWPNVRLLAWLGAGLGVALLAVVWKYRDVFRGREPQ